MHLGDGDVRIDVLDDHGLILDFLLNLLKFFHMIILLLLIHNISVFLHKVDNFTQITDIFLFTFIFLMFFFYDSAFNFKSPKENMGKNLKRYENCIKN